MALQATLLIFTHTGEYRPRPPVISSMPPMPADASGAPLRNLTVYVVPHSHDDTGWQRSVDEYYEEEVRYIYDSVLQALRSEPQRKFIFVETAYFMRWWSEQSKDHQNLTRRLFANGQLEFVNGGWCMADDASPTMDALIDQVTLGHRYITDTSASSLCPGTRGILTRLDSRRAMQSSSAQ